MFTSFEKFPERKKKTKTKVTQKHRGWNMTHFSMTPEERVVTRWEEGQVGPHQGPEWKVFGSGSVSSSPESRLLHLHQPVTLQTLANQEVPQAAGRKSLVLKASRTVLLAPDHGTLSVLSPVYGL